MSETKPNISGLLNGKAALTYLNPTYKSYHVRFYYPVYNEPQRRRERREKREEEEDKGVVNSDLVSYQKLLSYLRTLREGYRLHLRLSVFICG